MAITRLNRRRYKALLLCVDRDTGKLYHPGQLVDVTRRTEDEVQLLLNMTPPPIAEVEADYVPPPAPVYDAAGRFVRYSDEPLTHAELEAQKEGK